MFEVLALLVCFMLLYITTVNLCNVGHLDSSCLYLCNNMLLQILQSMFVLL